MKKLLLFTLMALGANSFAQTGTIKVSKTKNRVVVSAEKMNVLYMGVDNPLLVMAEGKLPSIISVTISNGTIMMNTDGGYTARVSKGSFATVYVSEKLNGGKTKILDSVLFRVKRVPSPTIQMGGKRDGDLITITELAGVGGIVAVLENFDFDIKLIISSFDVTAMSGGTLFTAQSNSNILTAQQKQILQSLKSGSKVYIENVKCNFPDGSVRMIPGLVLKVM